MPQKMLDVSKWQTSYNPQTAKNKGIVSTICRCAYGTSEDVCWRTFAPAVASVMHIGAYGFMTAHYASKASSFAQAVQVMEQQVRAWVMLCYDQGCEVLAIDQELEKTQTMALGKTYNTELLKRAVDIIETAGIKSIIYASASWILSYIDWAKLDCDFWVAYYPTSAATSDFVAYADGSFPSGRYGDLLRAMNAEGRLYAWQYGSTGNLGPAYGVASVNVDRNWLYKEVVNMDFVPFNGKLIVTSEKNPATQAFSTPNVNDPVYKNLARGEYAVTGMGGTITISNVTAPWVRLSDGFYCLALPDRCYLEQYDPETDNTEILEALENAKLELVAACRDMIIRAVKAILEEFEKEE